MSEPVGRPRSDDAALLQDFEIGVPGDFAKRENRLGFQDFEFAFEITPAIRDFPGERLVVRRGAAAGGGDVGPIEFEAVYGESERRPAIEIPFDVREVSGKARPAVQARVNGHEFRSTVAVYGGRYWLGLNKQVREAAGVAPGDRVTVELELDTGERTVDLPDDLAQAIEEVGVRGAFDSLSFTHRREHVEEYRAALGRAREAMASAAGDPRFQEAVFLMSPDVLRNSVRHVRAHRVGADGPNQDERKLAFEYIPAEPKPKKAKGESEEDDGDDDEGEEEDESAALVEVSPRKALPGPRDKKDRPKSSGTVPSVPRRKDD